jgi:hypothetical protein
MNQASDRFLHEEETQQPEHQQNYADHQEHFEPPIVFLLLLAAFLPRVEHRPRPFMPGRGQSSTIERTREIYSRQSLGPIVHRLPVRLRRLAIRGDPLAPFLDGQKLEVAFPESILTLTSNRFDVIAGTGGIGDCFIEFYERF